MIEIYTITTRWAQYELWVCGGRIIKCHESQYDQFWNESIFNVLHRLEDETSLGVTWTHEIVWDYGQELLI